MNFLIFVAPSRKEIYSLLRLCNQDLKEELANLILGRRAQNSVGELSTVKEIKHREAPNSECFKLVLLVNRSWFV